MKQIKRILALFVITVLISLGVSPVVFAHSGDTIHEIRILHTNDTHGRYQDNANLNGGIFGYDRLKTLADGSDSMPKADLILDAGDTFHGLSFATVDQGMSIARVMNMVGYTATTPGNHDFNYGAATLKDTIGSALDAKILSCNILDQKTGKVYFDPYMIQTLQDKNGNEIKVGILGITSPDIYTSTAPDNVKDLEFADPVIWSQKAVSELKNNGCTVIIALAHMGDSDTFHWKTSDLAKQVGGIDLIIDGHTHVEDKKIVKKDNGEETMIVQSGYYFANAGAVTLKYDIQMQKVVDLSLDDALLISSKAEDRPEQDPEVKTLIDQITAEQATILNQVVGTSPEKLPYSWETVRCQQQKLGTVIADAYIKATGADVAFENAGGIRGGIDEGEITKGEIINVSPFGNYVVTKEISAECLLEMIEDSLERARINQEAWDSGTEAWPSGSGSYLQWSGLKVVYRADKPKGERVVSVEIQDKPIDMDKRYKVATNQFVAGSDDYPKALKEAPILNEYGSCEEILMQYFGNESWKDSLNKQVFQEYREPVEPTVKPDPPIQDEPTPTIENVQESVTDQGINPKTGQFVRSALVAVVALLMVAGLVTIWSFIKGYKND